MQQEILNIDYHRRRLLIKALSMFTQEEAAVKMGVSRRTICRWLVAYQVKTHEILHRVILNQSNDKS